MPNTAVCEQWRRQQLTSAWCTLDTFYAWFISVINVLQGASLPRVILRLILWLILWLAVLHCSFPWKLAQLLLRMDAILCVSTISHALITLIVGAVVVTVFATILHAGPISHALITLVFSAVVGDVFDIIQHAGWSILTVLATTLGFLVVRRHWWEVT
jgi:hypothetical protein